MQYFKLRSGILEWSTKNINEASQGVGIYVLRKNPSIDGIIYIGKTENLKRRLEEHFLSEDIPGVLFFDYYQTNFIEEASIMEKSWIEKYNPKYNDRIG